MYLQIVKWGNKDSQSQIKNIYSCAVGTTKYLVISVSEKDISSVFSAFLLTHILLSEHNIYSDPKLKNNLLPNSKNEKKDNLYDFKFLTDPLTVLKTLTSAGVLKEQFANEIADQFPDGLGGRTYLDPSRAPSRKPQLFTSGVVPPLSPSPESESLFSSSEEDEGSEPPAKRKKT